MDYEFRISGTAKAVIQNSKTNGSCVPGADIKRFKMGCIAKQSAFEEFWFGSHTVRRT
jgi:hypothetical protein